MTLKTDKAASPVRPYNKAGIDSITVTDIDYCYWTPSMLIRPFPNPRCANRSQSGGGRSTIGSLESCLSRRISSTLYDYARPTALPMLPPAPMRGIRDAINVPDIVWPPLSGRKLIVYGNSLVSRSSCCRRFGAFSRPIDFPCGTRPPPDIRGTLRRRGSILVAATEPAPRTAEDTSYVTP